MCVCARTCTYVRPYIHSSAQDTFSLADIQAVPSQILLFLQIPRDASHDILHQLPTHESWLVPPIQCFPFLVDYQLLEVRGPFCPVHCWNRKCKYGIFLFPLFNASGEKGRDLWPRAKGRCKRKNNR